MPFGDPSIGTAGSGGVPSPPPLAAPAQAEPKAPSLLEQVGQLVHDAPIGLAQFIGGALTDPGQGAFLGTLINPGLGTLIGGGLGGIGAVGERLIYGEDEPWFEESEKLIESFKRTGSNIAHPSHYLDAIREGHIVGTLVEDVGNLTVAAGPLTKPLAARSARMMNEAAQGLRDAGGRVAAAEAAVQTTKAAFDDALVQAAHGGFDPAAQANFLRARKAWGGTKTAFDETKAAYEQTKATARRYAMPEAMRRLGDTAAFAVPFTPYRLAFRGAQRSLGALHRSERLASAAGGGGRFASLAEGVFRATDPERRAAERGQRASADLLVMLTNAGFNRSAEPLSKWASRSAKVLGDDPDLQAAAITVLSDRLAGVAEVVADFRRVVADESLPPNRREVAGRALESIAEQLRMSPEALDIAARYYDAADVSPEMATFREHVAKFVADYDGSVAPYLDEMFERNYGERGEASPEFIEWSRSNQALQSAVETARHKFDGDVRRLQKREQVLLRRWAKAAARARVDSKVLGKVETWQRVATETQRVASELLEDVPENRAMWEDWQRSTDAGLARLGQEMLDSSYTSIDRQIDTLAGLMSKALVVPARYPALLTALGRLPDDLPRVEVDLRRLRGAERASANAALRDAALARMERMSAAFTDAAAKAEQVKPNYLDPKAQKIVQRAAGKARTALDRQSRQMAKLLAEGRLTPRDIERLVRDLRRQVADVLGSESGEMVNSWERMLEYIGKIPRDRKKGRGDIAAGEILFGKNMKDAAGLDLHGIRRYTQSAEGPAGYYGLDTWLQAWADYAGGALGGGDSMYVDSNAAAQAVLDFYNQMREAQRKHGQFRRGEMDPAAAWRLLTEDGRYEIDPFTELLIEHINDVVAPAADFRPGAPKDVIYRRTPEGEASRAAERKGRDAQARAGAKSHVGEKMAAIVAEFDARIKAWSEGDEAAFDPLTATIDAVWGRLLADRAAAEQGIEIVPPTGIEGWLYARLAEGDKRSVLEQMGEREIAQIMRGVFGYGVRRGVEAGRVEGTAAFAQREATVAAAEAERRGATPFIGNEARAAQVREGAVADRGRSYGQIAAPAVRAVAREVSIEERLGQIGYELGRVAARREKLSVRQAEAIEAAADAWENAPARFRPVLAIAESVAGVLNRAADAAEAAGISAADAEFLRAEAASAVVTLSEAVRREIDPRYIPGGEPAQGFGTAKTRYQAGQNVSPAKGGQVLPSESRLRRSRQSRGEAFTTSVGDFAAVLLGELQKAADNEAVFRVEKMLGRSIFDLLSSDYAHLMPHDPALGRALTFDELRSGDYTPQRERLARQLTAALHEDGVYVWNPAATARRGVRYVEGVDRALRGGPDLLNETYALPQHIIDELHKHTFEGGRAEMAARRYYDPVLRVWKHATLALRPGWHIGNMIGNAVMAMSGAGIKPRDYARYMGQARKIFAGGTTAGDLAAMGVPAATIEALLGEGAARRVPGAVAAPAALLKRGAIDIDLRRQETGRNKILEQRRSGAPHFRGEDGGLHPIQWSYEVNGFVDDLSRTAVWLAAMDEGLPLERIAEVRASAPEFFADLSDAQVVNMEAIRLSIKTQGDFIRMRPTERTVLRRIWPFYPWLRHITKLTASLAVDHPMRLIWMMRLGAMVNDEDTKFSYGAVNTPFGLLDVGSNWNPYQTPLDLVVDRDGAVSAAGLTRSMSPILKAGAFAANVDLSRGLSYVTRPGDPFSRKPVLNTSPSEWWYFATQQVAQARLARQVVPQLLFGSEPVVRYGQGSSIRRFGATIPTDRPHGWWSPNVMSSGRPAALGALVDYFGLPTLSEMDVEERKATERRREAAADAALRRYDR